jgi:hypothetical protein
MSEPRDPDDPLDDLRERLRATREAAERLAADGEAARAEWEAGRRPGRGYATAEEHRERTDEVQALVALLQSLRDLVPDDLLDQVRDLVRQLLLIVRALIDWWVERIEQGGASGPDGRARGGAGAPAVEDIPVD